MKGFIALWSGAIALIPHGWGLCDGTQGTPDLRDKFVPVAGNDYDPDDSGGAITHTHPFTADGHRHDLKAGTGILAGIEKSLETSVDPIVGTTISGSSIPKYYALCYIMVI